MTVTYSLHGAEAKLSELVEAQTENVVIVTTDADIIRYDVETAW